MKKLKERLKAKTPKYARVLQGISGAIAAIPIYYSSLPDEFKQSVPKELLLYITIFGLIVIFFLNLLTVKK